MIVVAIIALTITATFFITNTTIIIEITVIIKRTWLYYWIDFAQYHDLILIQVNPIIIKKMGLNYKIIITIIIYCWTSWVEY